MKSPDGKYLVEVRTEDNLYRVNTLEQWFSAPMY